MPDEVPATGLQPHEHRAGAWVVLLVGIIGLGLGMFHWRSNFTDAFRKDIAGQWKTPEEIEAERLVGMKVKDTDADGINDFDESYIFRTSPYLADSDSDGESDRDELAQGSNPNCPKGSECGPMAGAYVSATSTIASDLAPPDYAQIERLLNPTADEIRQILIESGMNAAELEKIDDVTLIELYQESLKEAERMMNEKQRAGTP